MLHMILSALVHGVVYRAIWIAERGMNLRGAIAVAIAVICTVVIVRMVLEWRSSRRPRRRYYGRRGFWA